MLYVCDENGMLHQIGQVKIGQVGLVASSSASAGHRAPTLDNEFAELGDNYFSLGQDEDYYQGLSQLNDELRNQILVGLRDCAANLDIFRTHRHEEVMGESLLRGVHEQFVVGRFHRLARGDATLTKFSFTYQFPKDGRRRPPSMPFDVIPESLPPTNIHVLIGRNGVGKTRCMRQIALTLTGRALDGGESPGSITLNSDEEDGASAEFSSLVLVSFSAFDSFDLTPMESDAISCRQISLRKPSESEFESSGSKTFDELADDFASSIMACSYGPRAERWRTAIKSLEEDDLFAEADVTALLDEDDLTRFRAFAKDRFKRLSSGHAIIILTITLLAETVDERTLVLLDEPEAHLHPPLLAAFIRCLSDLLVRRNGVAIVATHSPVVLQEVPKSCAWKIRRTGNKSIFERPTIETFGENIGVLTREVFGLQVTKSGFHGLLYDAVSQGYSYPMIKQRFGNQLGDEARAIVQALIAERDQDDA